MEKLIIMGLAESGKTTIVKVTAEGYVPQKNAPYTATMDYKRSTYDLFGQKVSLFDLGGQKSFLERFVGDLAEFIFSNVSVLVYVIDIVNMANISLAKYYFDLGRKTLTKFSPNAKICILLHKIDMIEKSKKESFINNVITFLELEKSYSIFETSVYDKSILEAMENIIKNMYSKPITFKDVLHNFKLENNKLLDEIKISDSLDTQNSELKNIASPNLKPLTEMYNNMEKDFNLNDDIKYNFSRTKSKIIFSGRLNNYKFIELIFSINEEEELTENYLNIFSRSIKLFRDLEKFNS
ncbi:MAG: ADP-ribosylation factor-like protein [Candidatus Thorarchaeota archaeon]